MPSCSTYYTKLSYYQFSLIANIVSLFLQHSLHPHWLHKPPLHPPPNSKGDLHSGQGLSTKSPIRPLSGMPTFLLSLNIGPWYPSLISSKSLSKKSNAFAIAFHPSAILPVLSESYLDRLGKRQIIRVFSAFSQNRSSSWIIPKAFNYYHLVTTPGCKFGNANARRVLFGHRHVPD